MRTRCVVVLAVVGLAAGCGGDGVADHNKGLLPVNGKAGDKKGGPVKAPAAKGATPL